MSCYSFSTHGSSRDVSMPVQPVSPGSPAFASLLAISRVMIVPFRVVKNKGVKDTTIVACVNAGKGTILEAGTYKTVPLLFISFSPNGNCTSRG